MASSTVRRNIAANLVGRAWMTLLGFALIPLYLHFLGIEAYGLVGVFGTLVAVAGILDLGLGATLTRELARRSNAVTARHEQQVVVRTLELLYLAIAVAAGALVFLLAPALAEGWIRAERLSAATIERSVRLMGAIVALQFAQSFYQSALMGLQRQVLLNAILAAGATARGVVTVIVLWRVSRSVEAFFICQAAISLLQLAATVHAVWAGLGGIVTAVPRFGWLPAVWGFAAATSANSIVGITLTQVDKVLLSWLLPLDAFGYYVLAGSLASGIWVLVLPITQALFPRFTQLFESGDRATLSGLYHRASQALVLAVVPAAVTVAAFSWHVVWVWTGSAVVADHAAPIAALLVVGTAINGIVSAPGQLQAAAGWPQLMLYGNTAAAIALVPAILVVVPQFGAAGAAVVWLVLNAAYLVFNVPLMHRRLLPGEQGQWYRQDVALPAAAAVAVAIAGRLAMPQALSAVAVAVWVVSVWAAAAVACAALAPCLRPVIFRRAATAGASIRG